MANEEASVLLPAASSDEDAAPMTLDKLQEELAEEKAAHKKTMERLEAELADEKAAHRATLEKLEQAQEASQQRGAASGDAGPSLEDLAKGSPEELAKELQAAQAKIADLEAYTTELDGVTDSLQRQLEESKADPDVRLEEKEKVIEALQAEIERMEREMGGHESGDVESAINYDALDKLDEELAKAKEQCLLKDAEIARLQSLEEAARRESDGVAQWRESAIQAQADHRAIKTEYESKEREAEDVCPSGKHV